MTYSALILFTIACLSVETGSEDIYSDNGWRPTSSEKVFELRRNFIKTPPERIKNVPENRMDNVFHRNVKIAQRNNLLKGSVKVQEALLAYEGDNERSGRALGDFVLDDATQERRSYLNVQNNPKPNLGRGAENMAKTLNTFATDNILNINNLEKEPKEVKDDKRMLSKINNMYEVTEILDEANNSIHELAPRNTFKYNYKSPLETESNNLTSNLFKILANYNIRTSDKLPNYALSLRQNSRNSNNNEFLYMHVPVKLPLRYNSPNHIPIDPLLAVFLSNYGYYLPGLYGYQQNFKNFYGHLAANNIHNNMPFGPYKVFSDSATN